MIESPPQPAVTPENLVALVRRLCDQGERLVQICATHLGETIQLDYSFDREGRYTNVRLLIPATAPRVPSISSVYWAAFIYENEIHDLFGVQVDGMAVDFHGTFYKTTTPFPFAGRPQPAAPPAPAAPAPATTPPTSAAPVQ